MNHSSLFKIFSFIPAINLTALLVLILHAYFLNGHMPFYGNPDPQSLSFTYVFFVVTESLFVFSLFYYPYLIIRVILKKKLSKVMLLKYLFIFLILFIILLIVFRLEPYRIGEWIGD